MVFSCSWQILSPPGLNSQWCLDETDHAWIGFSVDKECDPARDVVGHESGMLGGWEVQYSIHQSPSEIALIEALIIVSPRFYPVGFQRRGVPTRLPQYRTSTLAVAPRPAMEALGGRGVGDLRQPAREPSATSPARERGRRRKSAPCLFSSPAPFRGGGGVAPSCAPQLDWGDGGGARPRQPVKTPVQYD